MFEEAQLKSLAVVRKTAVVLIVKTWGSHLSSLDIP